METGGLNTNALKFITALAANNNRDWFTENKQTYLAEIKAPAIELASEIGAGLARLTGRSQKPKVFRINRDLRFSKDKTPYNTHIHFVWSDIDEPRAPMWFWGLDTKGFAQGVGVFGFDKPGLETFRDYVAGGDGALLDEALHQLAEQGVRHSEPALKRVPSGFPPDHPREKLLRMKGISGWVDHDSQTHALGVQAVEHSLETFRRLLPIYSEVSRALNLAP